MLNRALTIGLSAVCAIVVLAIWLWSSSPSTSLADSIEIDDLVAHGSMRESIRQLEAGDEKRVLLESLHLSDQLGQMDAWSKLGHSPVGLAFYYQHDSEAIGSEKATFNLYALKEVDGQEVDVPFAEWRDEVEVREEDGPGPHYLLSSEGAERFELRGQFRVGQELRLVRELFELPQNELVNCGQVQFTERNRLAVHVERRGQNAGYRKLDQEGSMIRVHGPMNSDGMRSEFPAIKVHVKIGSHAVFSGLEDGAYAVECDEIVNRIDNRSYGPDLPHEFIRVELPRDSRIDRVVEGGADLLPCKLSFVGGPALVDEDGYECEFVVYDLSKPDEVLQRAWLSWSSWSKGAAKQTLLLEPGRYLAAIVPYAGSGRGSSISGIAEIEVAPSQLEAKIPVAKVQLTEIITQDSRGRPVNMWSVSGAVLSIGDVQLPSPVSFTATKAEGELHVGTLPIGTRLRIEHSDETLAIDANHKVIATISDEYLRSMGLLPSD